MHEKFDLNGDQLPDNERVSKFGIFIRKFSIDELPQIINVLKGEMSLVGPRPLLGVHPLYSKNKLKDMMLSRELQDGLNKWKKFDQLG